MKTVIIGGGKGGQALIELATGTFLKELTLDIQCVVDVDPDAPGMMHARNLGLKTSRDFREALMLPGIELVIELTGLESVRQEIIRSAPPGIRVIDHVFARVFWDLVNAQEELSRRLREVTELEEKIEQERKFLQDLFDTLPEFVLVLGTDRRTLRVNASFARFAGMSPDLVIGKSVGELLVNTPLGSRRDEITEFLDPERPGDRPRSVVLRIPLPMETYWEVTRTAITDEKGRTQAIMATWYNITEQVRLRNEIESVEQRFRSFIDSADDWICIKDLQGKYVIVNPALASSFGLRVADFIGRRPEDILSPALVSMVRHHDDEVIRDRCHYRYDEVFTIDGRDRHFQTVRFPLTDYRNEPIGVCLIARDVSPEHELRGQLIQAEKLAAVGKLAAGVAHEINNPLTGILSYAEDLLEETPEGDEQREDLGVIVRETLRCRDIVRNLLDFARQEKPNLEDISLNTVVEQAIALIQKLPQFRNVKFSLDLAEDVPYVRCDPQHIQQVILNLMLNAADAMEGSGTISLLTEYDRRQNRGVIAVEDTGPGIPENLIDKIFEPFFSTKGTNGLGLAVSWGIVERHRGVIEVDTAESGGAVFRVILPVAAEEARERG